VEKLTWETTSVLLMTVVAAGGKRDVHVSARRCPDTGDREKRPGVQCVREPVSQGNGCCLCCCYREKLCVLGVPVAVNDHGSETGVSAPSKLSISIARLVD